MNVLGKLLGSTSPFNELMRHLDKVMECVDLILPIVDAALEGEQDRVKEMSHQIFQLEHEADEIKNHIRDTLPREVLMPVSRVDFLAFLREQDGLADKAEDLAMMLSIRPFNVPEECENGPCADELRHLAKHAVEAAENVVGMTRRIDELRESGFKGPVVDELRAAAKEVGRLEHEADKHQYRLLRSLLSLDPNVHPFVESYTQMQVIKALSKLANHAESMSDYLRLMIAD